MTQMAAGVSSQLTPSTSTSTSTVKATNGQIPRRMTQHSSVRSQLYDLLPLPRHALFHVRLTIHQLWNVPLVGGEFSVRWKFQKVHVVRGSGGSGGNGGGGGGLRAKMKGKGKGKERERAGLYAVENGTRNFNGSTSDLHPPRSPGLSTLSLPEESSSSGAASPRLPSTPLPSTTTFSENGAPLVDFSPESRGRTAHVALQEHNVKWAHTVNVAVQIAVSRETKDLQPSELKLVVEQKAVHGDPDAPHNPRLGVVVLNLAEYADKGAVTRRYLLRESKTNATLQVTLELQHIDGEKHYMAPPLRKGEVMAEVANLLQHSPYGTLPRPSYSRKFSGLSARSAMPGRTLSSLRAPSPLPAGMTSSDSYSRMQSPAPDPLDALFSGSPESNNSLRTTDNIIEAIFNPVPTSSTASSPFTYYVPPRKRPSPLSLLKEDGSVRSKSSVSDGIHSPASTQASQSFNTSSHGHGDEPERSARSVHSQTVDSYEPSTTSASPSMDSSPAHSAIQSYGRKWWQKLTGSRRHVQSESVNAPSQSRPPSPNRHERQNDDSPHSSVTGMSSVRSSESSVDVDPGVQIYVQGPTSPPL